MKKIIVAIIIVLMLAQVMAADLPAGWEENPDKSITPERYPLQRFKPITAGQYEGYYERTYQVGTAQYREIYNPNTNTRVTYDSDNKATYLWDYTTSEGYSSSNPIFKTEQTRFETKPAPAPSPTPSPAPSPAPSSVTSPAPAPSSTPAPAGTSPSEAYKTWTKSALHEGKYISPPRREGTDNYQTIYDPETREALIYKNGEPVSYEKYDAAGKVEEKKPVTIESEEYKIFVGWYSEPVPAEGPSPGAAGPTGEKPAEGPSPEKPAEGEKEPEKELEEPPEQGVVQGAIGKTPGAGTTTPEAKPGTKYYINPATGTIYDKEYKGTNEVPESIVREANDRGGITNVQGDARTGYTYTFASKTKLDEGLLEDYRVKEDVSIKVNPDGSEEKTVETTTERRTGIVERAKEPWEYAGKEKVTEKKDKDKNIEYTETTSYAPPEIDEKTGKVKTPPKPISIQRTVHTVDPETKEKRPTEVQVRDPETGSLLYVARTDGTQLEGAALKEHLYSNYDSKKAEAANKATALRQLEQPRQTNLENAERNLAEKNRLADEKIDEWDRAIKEGKSEAEIERLHKESVEASTALEKAVEEKEKAETELEELKESEEYKKAQAEADAAAVEVTEAQKEADNAGKGKDGKPKEATDKEKDGANGKAISEGSGFWATLKLMGTARVFGKFLRAYDTYSGLRQYSAIGLGNYEAQVQRNKAKIQQDFCLATGIENCVTSAICGQVPDYDSDNILVGRGPTGQYVSSGHINAERSIPIELEGMTRQQLINLFGNQTIISGRQIDLTDPKFDPKILGKMKVWLYHIQYSITNNQVGELYGGEKKLKYNVHFRKANPGQKSSYGIPVKDAKWYPTDKELEYGQTGTDGNEIWKFSATEYTDACLQFEPGLPSGGAGAFSSAKVVNELCTPFEEYPGGPTEIGETAAGATAQTPEEEAGRLI